MRGGRGSRILITTRSETVATISDTAKPYTLRGLNQEESWSLFKEMAFKDGKEPENSTIKAIGKEVARKCQGVPLAIRTIGGMLRTKYHETEWLNFKENKLSRINQEENEILPTLKLSYDVLPSHLKHCFAYCSLFPPDYEIFVPMLIRLWVAQGFIKSFGENESLEDVAYEYFMELLCRSFFQEEKDEFGIIRSCKMHDLMNELAVSVSGVGSIVVDLNRKKFHEKLRHVSFNFHVDPLEWEVPTSLLNAKKIRTFLLPCQDENNSLLRDSAAGLGELGRLKELRGELVIINLRHEKDVMSESNVGTPLKEKQHLHSLYLGWKRGEDVNAIDEKDIIMSMEVLQPHSNLKKLSVFGYGGVRFASWFSSLINLVDLRLWGCHRCQHLPPLDHFPSLKTLHLGGLEKLEYISDNTSSSNSMSDEMMTSLEFLWVENCPVLKGWWRAHTHNNASSSSSTENLSLPSFPSLSQLTIRKCPNLSSMPLYPNVERIDIEGCSSKVVDSLFVRGASVITHDVGVDVSASSSSPHLSKLTCLSLIKIDDCPNLALLPYHGMGNLASFRELTVINCSNLTSMSEGIANLTSLQKLTIGEYSDLTLPPEVVVNLPSLQSLTIESFPNLVSLPEEISNLTSLQHLAIRLCSNLASLPEGIRGLPNLNRLEIWSCPMLSERCEKETGEDWPKIAHIPSISIY
ncbi:hypothetical protein ACFX1Z_031003 [Malus domestica]